MLVTFRHCLFKALRHILHLNYLYNKALSKALRNGSATVELDIFTEFRLFQKYIDVKTSPSLHLCGCEARMLSKMESSGENNTTKQYMGEIANKQESVWDSTGNPVGYETVGKPSERLYN